MSNSLADLRHHLKGARQMGSVVRAMKAVSAASISQYEQAVAALEPYQHSVDLALSLCLRNAAPNVASRRRRRVAAVVFGSDQGLVGRFNEIVGELATQRLRALDADPAVWIVGERLSGIPHRTALPTPGSVAAITVLVGQIQLDLTQLAAESREVWVFHNRPTTASRYEPTAQRLLPLEDTVGVSRWPGRPLPEVLGGSEASLSPLLHEHVFIRLYRACAESLASEHASRLAAMQRAEKNIETVAADLQRLVNKTRQGSIDEELFDVVAGFDALES
jgi:F-type H+-transporting ATPase subunit gamma